MNPAFLDSMSWEMAEVYGAITDQILINLARHFPFYVAGEDVPTSAFAYQSKMLAQMGQVNKETVQIIRNGLAGADDALKSLLEQSIIDAVRDAEPELVEAVKKGVFAPPSMPIVSPNQMRTFDLYYKQSADKLNLVNTVMLESTRSAYGQAVSDVANYIQAAERINNTQTSLNIAAGETLTGVSSWNQALRHATDRMKNGGITGFIDHAGRRWSAEAYVAMDIRTTVMNTGCAAVWETNQSFGNDLYIVSYHNGARPLCYPYQNKVVSSLDAARTVVDLNGNAIEVIAQSSTSYGEPAGLFGINCGHYPTPFIPGVSVADGKPQDKEDNDRVYAESQEQRRLERKLREEKRDVLMAKAQGAPQEEIDRLQEKCRQTSSDIDDFCAETGRARHRDREAVYTKREFPDADKYDVARFEKTQKEYFDNWFGDTGAQQNYTFGQMTPNEPLVPVTPVAPVAPNPDVMTYGKPFDYYGNRSAQREQFANAKETLKNAPEPAKKAWGKCANDLKTVDVGSHNSGAFYSPGDKRTHFKSYKECFEESSYQRKNTVFFHEYGHNLDNLLGGGGREYLSMNYIGKNGHSFTQVLEKEIGDTLGKYYLSQNNIDLYEAVKAAQNAPGGMGFGSYTRQMLRAVMPSEEYRAIRDILFDAGDDDSILRPLVDKWLKPQFETELRSIVKTDKEIAKKFVDFVKSRYSVYEVSDVSDIYGNYLTRAFGHGFAYPFGVGHEYSYQLNVANMGKEAFAEFYSAMVTGSDSLKGINDFFPESYKFFEEMLESV